MFDDAKLVFGGLINVGLTYLEKTFLWNVVFILILWSIFSIQ